MKLGSVIRTLQTKSAVPFLDRQQLLLIRCEKDELVAIDPIGAAAGEQVLLVTGTVAEKYCLGTPADAVAVAILNS